MGTIEERLARIEAMLLSLLGQKQPREWYSVEEFAGLVGRAEFTCRQWCRQGRIRARKKDSGRGAHMCWAISHAELQRYRREGLIQLQCAGTESGKNTVMQDAAESN